ncbi:MAG: DUF4390 domain-containing protein [Polyangiaceae bacterium]|nr:DUF4390 domain-containing protein [Polyangiaceae bacterium]MCW5790510.1 DUF4390 domain-containing protein [Polyangiaceae bacterium]
MTRALTICYLSLLALATGLTLTLWAPTAAAQEEEELTRRARFHWDADRKGLYMTVSFTDVIDEEIQKKLRRGLPTTIVFTGTIYRPGVKEPISTTVQTCKITWHVWKEAYRVEITQPGLRQRRWVAALSGVLRRCGKARSLLIADRSQASPGQAVYAVTKVQVNPVSDEVLKRLKRWVSRPSGTGTAVPGDALFSTFTGLFLQRVGKAERERHFSTPAAVPRVKPKQ